jgi:hypothetical protein
LETELALERDLEESRQDGLARARIEDGELECDECGEWADEDDLVTYQDQRLCPACHREYVIADFEDLVKEIKIAFGGKITDMAADLLTAMEKEI